MNHHIKTLLRHACAVLISAVVLAILFGTLTKPKFRNDNYWPQDVTYEGFYQMEKDSVDVLFLGSSHAISAFSPQAVYDHSGIRSFNLSSEEQSLFISYYWLKEALRTQSLKAVVLDTRVCFPLIDTPYNCSEPSIRKALDPMQFSPVKFEAIRELHKLDEQETLASFIFPLIRYHARWKELNVHDVHFWPPQRTDLKGYAVLSEDTSASFEPFTAQADAQPSELHPLMKYYLDQISDLCREKGIELILVSTPYTESSVHTHAAIAEYAQSNQLLYIDFCEADAYQKCGFDFMHDMADEGHSNTFGAVKLSEYIADILLERGISPVADAQYEVSRSYVNRQIKNANLYRIDSLQEYLAQLDYDDYLIFVTGSDQADAQMLNLEAEGAFSAVMEHGNGTVFYEPSGRYLLKENMRYRMSSSEMYGLIEIYDQRYERSSEGLQIVLFDREKGYVIDHSVFDENGMRIQ